MAAQSINEAYRNLARVEDTSVSDRKAAFLRPLALGSAGVYGLALIIMLMQFHEQPWYNYAIVGLWMALYIGIYVLNNRGSIDFSAHLFCNLFNLGIFVMFFANIQGFGDPSSSDHDGLLGLSMIMAMIMSLSILFAGMLIRSSAGFWFAGLNTVLISACFLMFTATIDDAITFAFPIIAFTWLMATVSWLYQRSLSTVRSRLNAARQEVMKSELLRRDLQIARELQERLYPSAPASSGTVAIASLSEPARETSGDFYDFIAIDPTTWAIVVGDVAGKSLAAAMVMTMARSIIRSSSQRGMNPVEVIDHANQVMCADGAVRQLTTAFYGLLDTQRMTLRFASAGHPFPILKRKGQVRDLELCGFPLGAWDAARYSELLVQLQPGDQLVLVSDGIIEAMNRQRELFGFERLTNAIARSQAATPQDCLDSLWQAVQTFEAGAEQQDDKTVVVIQVAAAATESLPQNYKLFG
jgi:hypothetical protein